ncbi:MAG: GNAT family N-acetyltransferase [Minisyncoccota bacterium]
MTIIITTSQKKDAEGIQNVFYKAWLLAYPNTEMGITEADIHEHFKDTFSEESLPEFADRITAEVPNRLILIAKDGDMVIGICRVFIRGNMNQLQAIYILPEYQRKGVGTMLCQKAFDFFDPKKDTVVHVATYNTQAINFYKKLGFIDTGKRFTEERHRMPVSGVLIPELEMMKSALK